MRHTTAFVAAFLTLALSLAVPAAAQAESMEFEVRSKVSSRGKEKPSLTVHVVEDTTDVVIALKRSDGKKVNLRTGRMKAGDRRTFSFDVPPGREITFTGTIERRHGKTIEGRDVEFVVEIVTPARIVIDTKKIDLEARTLELTSSRKCAKVEIEVYGEGKRLGTTSVPFDGAEPGTPLKVQWSQEDGKAKSLVLRVWDTDNFFEGLEYVP